MKSVQQLSLRKSAPDSYRDAGNRVRNNIFRFLTPKSNCLLTVPLILISSFAFGQRQALTSDKIGRLVPHKVKGYTASNFKNSLIVLGTLRYSLAERSFSRGNKSLKVLLFDYAEAPIMFDQAIRKWSQMNSIENDSVIYRPYAHTDSTSWESYSLASKKAQIVMGINKRFFLTVTGEKLELEELHQILTLFPFEKYPK